MQHSYAPCFAYECRLRPAGPYGTELWYVAVLLHAIIIVDIVHAIMPAALATICKRERRAKVCSLTMQFEREIDESTFQRGIRLA